MKSPAEFYIRFLLSQPNREDDDIRRECRRLGLPLPSAEYLQLLRESMEPWPRNYNPSSRKNKRTDKWLADQRIRDAWRQTRGFQQAMKVLETPAVRELVEAVILTGVPVAEFREDLPEWLREGSVHTYRHFFFQVDFLETVELQNLVEKAGGLRELAYCCDPDPEVARALLRFRMRRGTMEIPLSLIAKKVVTTAASALLETSTRKASPEGALIARRYGALLETGHRLSVESGAGMEDIVEIFSRLQISTAGQPERVPTFQEYTGGQRQPDRQALEKGGTGADDSDEPQGV